MCGYNFFAHQIIAERSGYRCKNCGVVIETPAGLCGADPIFYEFYVGDYCDSF